MRVHAETRRLTAPLPGGGGDGMTVAVEPLVVGHIHLPGAFYERAKRFPRLQMVGIGIPRSRWWRVPVQAFVVHHPSAGPFLVDTGLHPSVASKPQENLGRLLASWVRPELAPGEDLPAQLRARGIDPKSIRLVVMTHLHFDHASAMAEFPGATFVLTEDEWVAATTDRRPIFRGYRPAHYDFAFDYRTLSYSGERISSYSTFGRTFDLFGDGSVRLASTPGHSVGHQSVICRLSERDLIIAGDAVATMSQLRGGVEQPAAVDLHTWRRSVQELQLFARQYPQALIVPGHDREFAEAFAKRYE